MNNVILLMYPGLHCKVHEDDAVVPLAIGRESVSEAKRVLYVRWQQPI
jgi:hypothetical protein